MTALPDLRTQATATTSGEAASVRGPVFSVCRNVLARLWALLAANPAPAAAGAGGEPVSGDAAGSDGETPAGVYVLRSSRIRLNAVAQKLERELSADERQSCLLTFTDGFGSILWIDAEAYVELHEDEYRVVLPDVFNAQLTLTSADQETVVQFVRHYITARRNEAL